MALILDGTTGLELTGATQPLSPSAINAIIQTAFPTGTKMMFVQTAAPTGWTKDTTHDNKALRVVNGTAGTGGTVAFTTAFASKAVSGTVGNTTLTTSQIPPHTHLTSVGNAFVPNTPQSIPVMQTIPGGSFNFNTGVGPDGGGGSHNHSFTGTAIDMAVQYVDVIICTKQ
jgi:hypothetical protein